MLSFRMKSLLPLFFLVGSYESFAQQQSLEDYPQTVFIDVKAKDEQIVDIANKTMAAVGYGVWTNQALNSAGDKSKFTAQTEAEGPLTQLLRAFSNFDLYMTAGVRRIQQGLPAGESISAHMVSVPVEGGVQTQETASLQRLVGPVKTMIKTISPLLDFNVAEFPENAYSVGDDGQVVYSSGTFNKMARQGLAGRYHHLVEMGHRGRATGSLRQRVAALYSTFLPLAIQGELQIHPPVAGAQRKKTTAKYQFYYPAIGELVGPEVGKIPTPDEFASWRVVGLTQQLEEDKVIRSELAEIHRIEYMAGERGQDDTLMKVEVEKDFSKNDELDVAVTFGHRGGSEVTGSLIEVSKTDVDDALVLKGIPKIRKKEERPAPSTIGGRVKEAWLKAFEWETYVDIDKVNAYLSGFELELNVHKMAIILKRPESGDFKEAFATNHPFYAQYNPEKSHLSYTIRTTLDTANPDADFLERLGGQAELWAYENLGKFNCQQAQGTKYNCVGNLESFRWIVDKYVTKAIDSRLPVAQRQLDEVMGEFVLQTVARVQAAKKALEELAPKL